MNLGDLIAAYRSEADDNAQPPMCSDDELRIWANQAEQEACRRAHLIRDSRTPEICQVAATAGQPSYFFDKRVVYPMRVKSSLGGRIIHGCKSELMDRFICDWESQKGDPDRHIVGMNTGELLLWPTPKRDLNLTLTVIRLPLQDMESPMDEPEIAPQYHHALVQWMLYRAYSKKDVEIYDLDRSRLALKVFEEEFGTRDRANAQIEQMELSAQSYLFNSGLN